MKIASYKSPDSHIKSISLHVDEKSNEKDYIYIKLFDKELKERTSRRISLMAKTIKRHFEGSGNIKLDLSAEKVISISGALVGAAEVLVAIKLLSEEDAQGLKNKFWESFLDREEKEMESDEKSQPVPRNTSIEPSVEPQPEQAVH